tara:strand:+ start:1171 stop:1809 length:639 start_codon:yes stop_codon:yes gene_type:complete
MKRLLCFIIIVISISSGISQTREIFLNDNLEEITKESFEQNRDLSKFLYLTFSTDELIVNLKTKRVVKGKISDENLSLVRKFLFHSIGKKIPDNNNVVINYWPGNEYCELPNDPRIFQQRTKKYQKKIAKVENSSQFFVTADLNGIDKIGDVQWNVDSESIFQNLFFENPYHCGSFVLIDSEGNYYLYKGEYDYSQIFELLKNEKTTFANNA